MPAEEKVFTEAQHFALLTSAVERETASLSEQKSELEVRVDTLESEKASLESSQTELQNRIDVLESEKAAEASRADAAEQAFEAYKNELAEFAAIETRKTERAAAVKAADESLVDEYFTEARVQRWAEMADEQFEALVADLTEAAAAKKPFPPKADDDGDEDDAKKEKARETAAFKTGKSITAPSDNTFGSFLTAAGFMPATAQN